MNSRLKEDIEYLKKAFSNHKGKWLDEDGVRKYQNLLKKGINSEKEKRELYTQMIEEYGITELEAVNILNGRHIADYIAKYERIRTQTPLNIKEKASDKASEIKEEEIKWYGENKR